MKIPLETRCCHGIQLFPPIKNFEWKIHCFHAEAVFFMQNRERARQQEGKYFKRFCSSFTRFSFILNKFSTLQLEQERKTSRINVKTCETCATEYIFLELWSGFLPFLMLLHKKKFASSVFSSVHNESLSIFMNFQVYLSILKQSRRENFSYRHLLACSFLGTLSDKT